jgi:peroxiredoxin
MLYGHIVMRILLASLSVAALLAFGSGSFPGAWTPQAAAEPAQAAAGSTCEVGKPAPAFTLTDSHGKAHKLSDYKGKFVVLEWINFDCPFVQKHYKSGNMQRLQEKYTAKGVTWLSISSSAKGRNGNYEPKRINELLQQNNSHTTAYLIDEDGKVGKAYGAKATPHMFVIDPAGKLVYAGAIDDKNTADEADIKAANNYVAAALDAAMAGKPVAVSSTKAYGCSIKYKD